MHKQFTNTGYQMAKDMVTAINLLGGQAKMGETWMDYGADISWETILVYHSGLNMDYQALDPRDFNEMNDGTISVERVREIVETAVKRNRGTIGLS